MISRTKLAAGLAGVASLFLITGTTLSAGPASATPSDPVACTVNGTVTITPGVELPPGTHTNTFTFTQSTLSCSGGPNNDDAGTYTNVSATGSTEGLGGAGTFEDCTGGETKTGTTATITATTPHEGDATGTFTFTRTGTVVKVDGSFGADGENHPFTATLQFTPPQGQCVTGPATSASITGTAHIHDDSET